MTNNQEKKTNDVKRASSEHIWKFKCVCCGRYFETTDPKIDTCQSCMIELSDFLAPPQSNWYDGK